MGRDEEATDVHVLYLHGFASSPASSKAAFFAARLEERGVGVTLPDLNEGDFEHLTIRRMLATIEREAAPLPSPLVVIGSSLGGYAAALHAARNGSAASGRPDGLVLLAPAFDPVSRWSAQARPGDLARWERDGSAEFEHHAYKRKLPLHWDFFADAATHEPWPGVGAIPTLVLAGTRDAVVPIETAREYARRHPEVRLEEVDTDHEMLGALPEMWNRTERFLESSFPDIW
jgi:pimeloyl-ACP methyl ester carboxylesterase